MQVASQPKIVESMQILKKLRLVRDHPYQEKDWVGGSKNWPVLLTFSTVLMLT